MKKLKRFTPLEVQEITIFQLLAIFPEILYFIQATPTSYKIFKNFKIENGLPEALNAFYFLMIFKYDIFNFKKFKSLNKLNYTVEYLKNFLATQKTSAIDFVLQNLGFRGKDLTVLEPEGWSYLQKSECFEILTKLGDASSSGSATEITKGDVIKKILSEIHDPKEFVNFVLDSIQK